MKIVPKLLGLALLAGMLAPCAHADPCKTLFAQAKLRYVEGETNLLGEERTELNPSWREPSEADLEGEWERFGSGYAQASYGPVPAYFTTKELNRVTLETEPFELREAKFPWEPATSRASGGYVVRDRHTGEIIAMIQQGFGWSWDITLKRIRPGEKQSFSGNTLRGGLATLFDVLDRYSLHELDGRAIPGFRGSRHDLTDPVVASIAARLDQSGIRQFYLARDYGGWHDFRPATRTEYLLVTYYPGYGFDVLGLDNMGGRPFTSQGTDNFFKMLAENPGQFSPTTHGGQAEELKPFAKQPLTLDMLGHSPQ